MEQILAQLRSAVLPIDRAWRERRRDSGQDIAEIYNRAGAGYAAYADGELSRIEETYAASPNFIEHAAHLLLVAHRPPERRQS